MPRSQRPPAVYPCGRARLTRVPPATECACPNLPYTPLFRSLTVPQNMALLRRLRELTALGRPLFIGTSRKGSIGRVLNLSVDDRLEGTAATVAVAIANGADFVRVHDVAAMVRVARMTDAIVRGWPPAAGGAASP